MMQMFLKKLLLLPAVMVSMAAAVFAAEELPTERAVDVFVPGKGNPYVSIRIPDVVKAGNSLVAIAEGRYKDTDQGQNDLIVSMSSDGGKKWSAPVVAAKSNGATFNNPCLVYDWKNKQLVLFFQRFPEGAKERDGDLVPGDAKGKCIRNFVCFSKNGKKWTEPRDVTATTKSAQAKLTCSGPNPGVMLSRGPHKGRIVIPFNEGSFNNWHIIAAYSDDGGKTWQLGKPSASGCGVNEVSMAETEEGGLIIVSRAWPPSESARRVAYSADGGESWGEVVPHTALPSPNCQNGLLRYSFAKADSKGGKSRLLFSSPSSRNRTNGIVKMSYDDGKTWPVEKALGPGSFAYSVLTRVKPGVVGILYESDGKIRFTTFSIKWLTSDKQSAPLRRK